MHLTKSLAVLALTLTGALASPTPRDGTLKLTTHEQDLGINYTVYSTADTGPPLQEPGASPDDCPECGPDGQPPLNSCGASTFVDQTSAASPLGDDCLNIAKNVVKGGKWNVESVTGRQH